MEHESRVKKSLLNARVNLIFYFLTLLLSFFSRKIFLDCLGADFIGLTGTLYNLLGFLNLAELGVGSAIGYVLYKPLFDHDQQRINEIISVMGYLYRWIGFAILGAGCILACFLPLLYPGTGFNMGLIYFAFFSFLASSLIGYFINYRQNLLGADQRNYVVTAYFQGTNILKTLLQMGLAYKTGSYYLWIVIELVFAVFYSFVLNWKLNQTYPWLRSEVRLGRQLFRKYPEVMRYTRQLFIHKSATFVQYQTTPYIIYAFISLKMVAYYTNYIIVVERAITFMRNLLDSTSAGVGNLIAEGNNAKIVAVFWKLISVRFWFAGLFVYALFRLLPPFITLWIGPEYVLPQGVLVLIVVSAFLEVMRGVTDQYIFGYGLFYDIWAPAVESVISIALAIVGGHLWGLEGILLGPVVSKILIVYFWKSFFLYNKGFHLSVTRFWPQWLFYLFLLSLTFAVTDWLLVHSFSPCCPLSWSGFLLHALLSVCLYGTMYYVLLLCFSKGMRSFSKEMYIMARQRLVVRQDMLHK